MRDDNVHPNNTWQLVDALQEAGRPFDMMLYPDAAHGLSRHATELRWDYLRRHLDSSAP
jgi:dipeptidyl aminopeptidase/acylaminoacyl peptidase